jgi:hypothetical protein
LIVLDVMQSFESKELPPESYRKKIEAVACSISDPVQKLRFLKRAIDEYPEKSGSGRDEISFDVLNGLSGNQNKFGSGGKNAVRDLRTVHRASENRTGRFRVSGYFMGLGLFLIFIFGGGMLVFPFKFVHNNHQKEYLQHIKEPLVSHAVHYPAVMQMKEAEPLTPVEKKDLSREIPKYLDKLIWMVEKSDDSEYYSNRLKINTTQTIENIPRGYYLFKKADGKLLQQGVFTNQIKGILYHASESDVFAYRPEMTQSIKEYSRLLIRYLNKKKAYHYFIDRFGKIYRLIQDDHVAFHSGNSIWADDEFLYLDLNHAFIGVCFEGKDFEAIKPSDTSLQNENHPAIFPMERSSINEAQLISGKELTDWLRVKYKISQNNCIPHGLVSVNPYDRLIGHHLDLSHGFPFDFFEISNKYEEPIPAITEFGFTYDNYFVEIFQGKLWAGIAASEKIITMRANGKHMSVVDYRKMLNGKFRQIFTWMKDKTAVRNHGLPIEDLPGT